MSVQLTLPIQLQKDFTFDNYYAGKNQALIDYLTSFSTQKNQNENYLYLLGQSGSGRSHLLQAICRAAQEQQRTAIYLPLQQTVQLNPQLLENLEQAEIICLDDIAAIAHNKKWEEAIFHFYNRIQMNERQLIISAEGVPSDLNIQLPDLYSRINSGVILQLQPLSDAEKITVLKLQAKQRGLELSSETGEFLLHHLPRDLKTLFNFMDKLDQRSLVEQKKLTVPFIKKTLLF